MMDGVGRGWHKATRTSVTSGLYSRLYNVLTIQGIRWAL